MKNYLKFLLAVFAVGMIFYACTDNEQRTPDSKKNKNSNAKPTNPNTTLSTCCYITGNTIHTAPNCTVTTTAQVYAGTSTTYQYHNSTGTPTTYSWTPSPAGSMTVSGTGDTVTVTYAPGFTSGTLSCLASGGVGVQTCEAIVYITAVTPNCCAPVLAADFICRGSSLGGWVDIKSPTNCTVDWSNVSQIDLQLADASTVFTTAGPLYHQYHGTIYPPFNIISGKIHLPFYNPECIDVVECNATIHYSNGCPNVQISVETTGSN